jgi:hypothetical protein
MINKTVATKLNDDEHSKLIAECNRLGVTPSALMKEAVMEKIEPKEIISEIVPKKEGLTKEEMKKIDDLIDFAIWKKLHQK